MAKQNRYSQIIESIFLRGYSRGINEILFSREDFEKTAEQLGLEKPKNLGDIIYSFRYRNPMPAGVLATAPGGFEWIIRSSGRSLYKFVLMKELSIAPNPNLSEAKILDATPGIIGRYAMNDEQALLAKVRYNRLIDIFTGLTCYSLQNHLRTTVPDMGQVETDEIYIGVDKRGAHYLLPVQAKGGKDKIGRVQIEQDFAIGQSKFPDLICKPIAAQFTPDRAIALFEFEMAGDVISISSEKQYRLVQTSDLSEEEQLRYQQRPE